jgi:hypothetical protein
MLMGGGGGGVRGRTQSQNLKLNIKKMNASFPAIGILIFGGIWHWSDFYFTVFKEQLQMETVEDAVN